jgi:hypothetical protein
MDSPLLDTNSPLDHYQNNWILPEESIVFSQPSLFLMDMETEKEKEFKKVAKQVGQEMAEKVGNTAALKKEQGLQIKKAVKQKKSGEVAKINKPVVSKKVKVWKKEDEKKITTEVEKETVEEEEKKVTAISMEQVKNHLSGILEMEESALKALCKEKGILAKGRSTMKHKYAYALFCDMMMQL